MEAITGLLQNLWSLWMEMIQVLFKFALKFFIFILWVLAGIIVLPCVFIAGTLYPKWTEWGEKI